jgi:hypothetical protein
LNIGELFVKLGVKADTKELKSFTDNIKDLPNQIFSLKNALLGLTIFGLDKMIGSTVDSVVALENFNKQTGLSIDTLQHWQRAGEKANLAMSPEQITQNIAALQKSINDYNQFGIANQGLNLFGIQTQGKDAFKVLEQIRAYARSHPIGETMFRLNQTGLSSEMINVLKLSKEEFDKLGQGNFLGEKGRKSVMALGLQIKNLKKEFQDLKDNATADLEPVWKMMIKFSGKLVKELGFMVKEIPKSKEAILGLQLAFAGVAYAIAPIATAIAGLIWVIDDLTHYFTGDDESKLGTFIDWAGGHIASGLIDPEANKVIGARGENKYLNPEKYANPADLISKISKDAIKAAQQGNTYNTIFNVHSNAKDPKEVAHHVAEHFDKKVLHAHKYLKGAAGPALAGTGG